MTRPSWKNQKPLQAEPVGTHLQPIVVSGRPGQGKNRPKINPNVRARVYARDGYCCVYCGSPEDLTIDHKKALAKGGSNRESNYVTACRTCNELKADT